MITQFSIWTGMMIQLNISQVEQIQPVWSGILRVVNAYGKASAIQEQFDV